MKSLLIENAKIWDTDKKAFNVVDIFIEKKHITAILPTNSKQEATETLDAKGMLVMPGIIDLGINLREPGQTNKATIYSETRAAATNGITTLIATPDTTPVIDGPSVVELINQKSIKSHASEVLLTAALTKDLQGQHLSKMGALKDAGCIAFNQLDYPIENTQILRNALEYASSLGMKVIVHPVDQSLANSGCIHEGIVATRLGLKGIPDIAETTALSQWLLIAEYTRTHIHFSHISCKESISFIRQAKASGLLVTADVDINHLFLTEMDCATFNSQTRVCPPFRTERDREALKEAVNDGTIDIICSHHQPHNSDAKLAPFPDCEPGISGLDLFLPLLLRLVEDGTFNIETIIEKTSTNPANFANLQAGKIAPDYLANLIIVDTDEIFEVDPENFISAGKNTPYTGWMLSGKTLNTILKGKIIYSERNNQK
jgi:dihydroorotase